MPPSSTAMLATWRWALPLAGPRIGRSRKAGRIIRGVLSASGAYAIVLKETGLPVGSIGVIEPRTRHVDVQCGDLELGFWIGRPYWGQGLVPEAVEALLGICFANPACGAIWCGHYEGNEKSRRCQEKCGFAYHHSEPNKPLPLLGETRTEHYLRLTRTQWLAGRSRQA